MAENLHPGSFVGDTVEEFKKLPVWGKVLVGVIAVAVAYLAYEYFANRGSSGIQPTLISGGATSGGSSGASGSQSPFASVPSGNSNVPLLPSNVNPVYDAQGNLVGYQQSASTSPQTSTTPSSSSSNPVSAIAGYLGLAGPNAKINIAQDKKASDSTYVNAQGQTVPLSTLIPGNDTVVQGSDNRVWYTDSGGQHLLTSGTGPAIDPTTNKPVQSNTPAVTNQQNSSTTVTKNTGQGAGGESLASFWQAFIPRLQNYHPQIGDNMNEVAHKLQLRGGWRMFNTSQFDANQPVSIPQSIQSGGYGISYGPGGKQSITGPDSLSVEQSASGQSISAYGYNVTQNANGQGITGPNNLNLQHNASQGGSGAPATMPNAIPTAIPSPLHRRE